MTETLATDPLATDDHVSRHRDLSQRVSELMAKVTEKEEALQTAADELEVALQTAADELEAVRVDLAEAIRDRNAFEGKHLPTAEPKTPAGRRAARRRAGEASTNGAADRPNIVARKRNAAIRRFAAERDLECPETGTDFSSELVAAFERESGYQG